MAKDTFHQLVRSALIKDNWVITHDPYPLQLTKRKLGIDLGAEKIIAASREKEKIAVEVKSFRNDSFIYDFHEALGQYLVYQPFLQLKESDRALYLAIPEPTYNQYFVDDDIRFLINKYLVKTLVFDPVSKTILLWTK